MQVASDTSACVPVAGARSRPGTRAFASVCRYALAAVFAVAAMLKLMSSDPDGASAPLSGPVAMAAAAVELLLVVALLTFRRTHWPLLLSAVAILVFTTYLTIGELFVPGMAERCGCFGSIRMPFWQHIAISGIVLVLVGGALRTPVSPPMAARGS